MAIHKSAKKRIRRNDRRNSFNKSRVSEMRTALTKVEQAIKTGDSKKAQEAFREAQPLVQRTAGKGIMHKKTASRKLSRLSARVKAVAVK